MEPSYNPSELTLEEFNEWCKLDKYGNVGQLQKAPPELVQVLLDSEEYEKLGFLNTQNLLP